MTAVLGGALAAGLALASGNAAATDAPKLIFQTDKVWTPRVNVEADMVLAYGLDPSLASRIAGWHVHGYRVGFMTGVSWGHYPDYLTGKFDGRVHWDETQQAAGGKLLLHTGRETPYFVPTASYTAYLTQGVLRALDAGAEAVYLEEPELWADAGWSDAFKRAWQQRYGSPWQPPDSSPRVQYQASLLKRALYLDTVAHICKAVRDWGRQHQRAVPCNVATHSLLNYTQWRIVSPEHAFASINPDGIVGQVWTGTARAPNVYRGKTAERPFENAFLEYAALQELADAAGKRLWLLADPVEDNPHHTWSDYRSNWEATVVASLFQAGSAHFEILPWPHRIFDTGMSYPLADGGHSDIPPDYQIELQSVFHALGEMPADDARWLHAGTRGVGILTSDTMLFQRAAPHPSDTWTGDLHGLALPLVMHGVPVAPMSMEAMLAHPHALDRFRILLLSYHGQLPPSPACATRLADWVRRGGALVVVDDDSNPYIGADPSADTAASSPRQRLFHLLGLDAAQAGVHHVDQGVVAWLDAAPDALSHAPDGARRLLDSVRDAAFAAGIVWSESPALVMQRGSYVIAAGPSEPPAYLRPLTLHGRYLDLLNASLPLLTKVTISPGDRRLLLDLDATASGQSRVLAASGRTTPVQQQGAHLRFQLSGIEGRAGRDHAVLALQLPSKPQKVRVGDKALPSPDIDWQPGLLRLKVPATALPQSIDIVLAGVK